METIIRRARFAGSWYPRSKSEITKLFDSLFDKDLSRKEIVKGIVSPHAGYVYSAPVAAKAFSTIYGKDYNRVIVMGPCHRYYTESCLLTQATELECPLGNVQVDTETIQALENTKLFKTCSMKVEEQEHSLELMLPFLKYALPGPFKCVFIMVGHISERQQREYAKVLKPYMEDPKTIFVISSDFCHWGYNFDYFYYNKKKGEIYESIEWLDRLGAHYIEENDPEGFQEYLDQYENTICGRNPISIYLNTVKNSGYSMTTKVMDYAQSSHARSKYDSSVSYCGITSYINN